MQAFNLRVSGIVCAVTLALGASPAVAGHKHGGYYKHGHYHQHGGHGAGYGAHHRMYPRRAHPHCHAKRVGYDKKGHYGHHPMKKAYQNYNKPGGGDGHSTAGYYGGTQSERPSGYRVGYSSNKGDTGSKAAPSSAQKDIVGVAAAAENFSTLISAVKAAGLAETLTGRGPFTVLAPSDAAFSKLPEGQVSDLMGDTEALKDVLTYHVIAGELSAADLLEQGEATTVNGAKVSIAQLDVAKADIKASNGVIHVLNSVLIPTE